jgi:hypothetical protein
MVKSNRINKAMTTLKTTIAVLFASAIPAFAAEPGLAVDRGLPQTNLNNVSGNARSNVRWTGEGNGFVGDDFSIGAAGETWVIDSIRTWTVPQISVTSSKHLGDLFQDVRLYFGSASSSARTPVISTTLTEGSDESENANVTISELTRAGAIPYDDFGTNLRIWQLEFHLNRVVKGGTKYAFGAWGMGRAVPGKEDKIYPWFNYGTSALNSATQQDGADGTLLLFDGGGKFGGTFDSKGNNWDKSSDINVQVFAHRLKLPVE